MSKDFLLFPGRHHLLTNFQLSTIAELVEQGRVHTVVWAVTSADHSNTRRNPLPAHRREVAIELATRDLPGDHYVYLIDDIGHSDRFADYLLKKIAVDSGGRFELTPENTVLGCSTPEVIELYQRLGFGNEPFELLKGDEPTYRSRRPWQLVQAIVKAGQQERDWREDEQLCAEIAPASLALFDKYDFGDLVQRLHADPLLGADGDLTETRDYDTYIRSFDLGATRKYAHLAEHIRPGRVVDIGCCTGSLIREMARDPRLHECDFYGVEAAAHLYRECIHRKEQDAFASDHVFFLQRNVVREQIFGDHSVDTFTTVALTHELESYQGRVALERFVDLVARQLVLRGRWLNLDVVGPDEPEREVLLACATDDGRNDDWDQPFGDEQRADLKVYLDGMSTWARLHRFVRDFRHAEGEKLHCEFVERDGRTMARMRLADAMEFVSKKDFTDNWNSEMHERFCFFSFGQWCELVARSGLRQLPASGAFTNQWLVDNRYAGKADLLLEQGGALVPLAYPVTHMLLACEYVG